MTDMLSMIKNWSPPPCPSCGAEEMEHKLFTVIPNQEKPRLNSGWYCIMCKCGPYKLGNFSESDATQFSLILLNK